jgi:hypothetical protein
MSSHYKHEKAKIEREEREVQDLLNRGFEIVLLLSESPVDEYDFDNENFDDLPDAPQESPIV